MYAIFGLNSDRDIDNEVLPERDRISLWIFEFYPKTNTYERCRYWNNNFTSILPLTVFRIYNSICCLTLSSIGFWQTHRYTHTRNHSIYAVQLDVVIWHRNFKQILSNQLSLFGISISLARTHQPPPVSFIRNAFVRLWDCVSLWNLFTHRHKHKHVHTCT